MIGLKGIILSNNFYSHPQALIETKNIGKGTKVWAFAHILPKAVLGEDCNICDHTFIENDVIIGDRVTVKCGVQIWDGAIIEDDVFIGPNVTFTNDRFPRSKQYPEQFSKIIIKKGASIGANATLLPGITIGHDAMVGAGAVVTKDVPPNAIVVGNPASISGYVNTSTSDVNEIASDPRQTKASSLRKVEEVKIHKLPMFADLRGSLSVGEVGKQLPFSPKRYFTVFDVPSQKVRGEHAHKELHQFLVCLKGHVSVLVDNGKDREEIVLNSPSIGVHVPPMIWSIQYKYSSDAILLVLASHEYSDSDYIRDYETFMRLKNHS